MALSKFQIGEFMRFPFFFSVYVLRISVYVFRMQETYRFFTGADFYFPFGFPPDFSVQIYLDEESFLTVAAFCAGSGSLAGSASFAGFGSLTGLDGSDGFIDAAGFSEESET